MRALPASNSKVYGWCHDDNYSVIDSLPSGENVLRIVSPQWSQRSAAGSSGPGMLMLAIQLK